MNSTNERITSTYQGLEIMRVEKCTEAELLDWREKIDFCLGWFRCEVREFESLLQLIDERLAALHIED